MHSCKVKFTNCYILVLNGILKDAVNFLRKRASIEEEYGKSMLKLSQSMISQKSESKDG